jgi:hypothetical protein
MQEKVEISIERYNKLKEYEDNYDKLTKELKEEHNKRIKELSNKIREF